MRILLAEDEDKIAKFIIQGLKEEGYAIDHVLNGKEALSTLSIYEYDLLITDIIMPQMNGIDLVKNIREQNIKVPVLILSAKDQISDKVLGLDAGADDYLAKPFAFDELLARVRALLRRKADYKEKLEVGDLILEPEKHRVLLAGKVVDLTPKEYSLLEFLLRNKGRVVTRTAIIEHVWDMNFDSDTNLVDVFMSYLRKKVEPKGSGKFIHSIRGVGYMIKEND